MSTPQPHSHHPARRRRPVPADGAPSGSRHQDARRAADEAFARAARRADRWLFRRCLLASLAVFVLAFATYEVMAAPFAMPGDSADALASLAGIRTQFMTRHLVWRGLASGFLGLFPAASVVTAANLFSAFFSALGAAMACLALSQLVVACIDREHMETLLGGEPRGAMARTALLGGVAAAGALAFCPPYWSAATQMRPDAFYLSWLLFDVTCLLRFRATGRQSWLAAFAVLLGLGISQTSCFLAWAPVMGLYAAYVLFQRDRLSGRRSSGLLLLVLVPMLALLVWNAAAAASSPGIALSGQKTTWQMAKFLAKGVFAGVFSAFDQTWWMILVGLSVLPWLASLLAADRALNEEGGIAMTALHLAIATTTVLVLLDLRFSPWRLSRASSYQILPYAMTALSFGYLAAVLHQFLRRRLPDAKAPPRNPAAEAGGAPAPAPVPRAVPPRTVLVGALALAFVLTTAFRNAREADPRNRNFVKRFAEATLDGLDGRTWLATVNRSLDAPLLIEAHRRGQELHVVNLSLPPTPANTADYRAALPGIRLRTSADLGPITLIQDWIRRPDAGGVLALSVLPDFWNDSGVFADVPVGLAFLGKTPVEARARAAVGAGPDYVRLMDAFEEDFAALPEDPEPFDEYLVENIRRQVSFVANNLAFLMDENGRTEEAFELLDRTRRFDPDNVAALCNWLRLVARLAPDRREEAEEAVRAFQLRHADEREDVWHLAAQSGYVSDPRLFAGLGWSWALSGQPRLALRSLSRAMEDADPEAQAGLRRQMASVYLSSGDLEEAEQNFREILDEDAADPEAILGLANLSLRRGDFETATRCIEAAEDAGVPEGPLLYLKAAVELGGGDRDAAHARILAMLDRHLADRSSPYLKEALVLLSFIQTQDFAAAPTGSREASLALAGLRKTIEDLFKLVGNEDYQALLLRAGAEALENRIQEARESYVAALRAAAALSAKTGRIVSRIPILEQILALDFRLDDKPDAERRAMELLALDREHPFANYIMGSLTLGRNRVEEAEEYLSTALAAGRADVAVLNDLAEAKRLRGKYEEALELIDRTFEITDEFYGAWDTKGCILFSLGRLDEAAEALEEAVRINTDDDPRVTLHYARVLEKRGDDRQARALVSRLLPRGDEFRGEDAEAFRSLVARFGLGE